MLFKIKSLQVSCWIKTTPMPLKERSEGTFMFAKLDILIIHLQHSRTVLGNHAFTMTCHHIILLHYQVVFIHYILRIPITFYVFKCKTKDSHHTCNSSFSLHMAERYANILGTKNGIKGRGCN